MNGRRTRSNAVFSPWDMICITDLNPDFDLELLLQAQATEDGQGTPNILDPEDVLEDQDQARAAPSPLTLAPATSTTDEPPQATSPASQSSHGIQHPEPLNPHKRRRNDASHKARAKKRAKAEFGAAQPRISIRKRYAEGGSAVSCDVSLDEAPVTTTGYDALRDAAQPKKIYPLSYFVGAQADKPFTLLQWNGEAPFLLVDRQKRLVGVLAGHPNASEWPALQEEAVEAMEKARLRCKGSSKETARRGDFISLRCGVSHGGGQTKPGNLYNDQATAQLLCDLCGLEFFQRVSGFSASVLATRAPKLFKYCADTLRKLYVHDPCLNRPFPRSIQTATTFNLGPETACYPHRDRGNLAAGMCSITSLGNFDYRTGGHLVLWECKLVIEFPPGSTILIPSAIFTHSNTAITPGEHRYSFTQYTSGALFRWVNNQFQKATTYRDSLTAAEKKEALAMDANRWHETLSLLPVVAEKK